MRLLCGFLLLCVALKGAAESETASWLAKARQERTPEAYARDLLRADELAVKLERSGPSTGYCRDRCVLVDTFVLHYKFNSLAGGEVYQHDLLQLILATDTGSREGVEALVRLLPTGCQTIASVWTPYFKTVLDILETSPWRGNSDPRIVRIRAEAYETWWSLSKADPSDPVISDERRSPQDFADGAEIARQRAIENYRSWLSLRPNDKDAVRRIQLLEKRATTDQLKWYCSGD